MATNKRIIRSNDEAAGASFNTVTYTGNGSTQSISTVGFQPDLVWMKNREEPFNHRIADSVRGVTNYLITNLTNAESTNSQTLTSFDSNGFTVGSDAGINYENSQQVAWCWKAGGAAVTNPHGTLTSQISANPAAGFSIVTYTGNGSTGTIGHGLGDNPAMVITKMRAQNGGSSSTSQWMIYHKDLTGNTSGDNPYNLYFQTDQELDLTAFGAYNDITSTVIPVTRQSVSTAHNNNNLSTYVAYCFAEVAGFSKFGSYDGNAGSNFVSTSVDGDAGFEPAFVMIKRATGGTGNWFMHDNKRLSPSGYSDLYLTADTSDAEIDSSDNDLLFFNENGFTLNTTFSDYNAVSSTYIYMAFANQF